MMTGTVNAKLRLFGEDGIVFVANKFAERRIGNRISHRIIVASVMVTGETAVGENPIDVIKYLSKTAHAVN